MDRLVPIIKLFDTLIVPVQIELDDQRVLKLRDDIAQELTLPGVKALIIEVSGLDVFDSFVARVVGTLAQVARLMGVRTLVSGIKPGMAMSLIELDLPLPGVTTVLNLEAAMAELGHRPQGEDKKEDPAR